MTESKKEDEEIKRLIAKKKPKYLKSELSKRNISFYQEHYPFYSPLTIDGTRLPALCQFRIEGIVLFSGNDPVSEAIKLLTNSPFSHVGILLNSSLSGFDVENLYCFEATGKPEEVIRGKYPFTRVTPYQYLLENYGGEFCYRRFYMESDDDEQTRNILNSDVTPFVAEYDFNPYETNAIELIKSLKNKNRKAGDQKVFCSELVARMLYFYGFFPSPDKKFLNDGKKFKDPNFGQANNFVPAEFSSFFPTPLLLEAGIKLTEEKKGKGIIEISSKNSNCCKIF